MPSEDTLKKMVFGFVLTSLFTVLILTSVTDSGRLYDKNTTEVTSAIGLSEFNNSISTIQDDSDTLRERFERQNIFSVVAGIIVTGIFDIAVAMITMIFLPFTIIAAVLTNIIGIPAIVSNVISGLLGISIILAIWALIRIGK